MNITKEEFLKNFDGYCLCAYDDKGQNRKFTNGYFGEKAKDPKIFEGLKMMNENGAGIFFSVNSFPERRLGHLCTGVNAWWVERDDVDKETQLKDLNASPVEPSIIVESGKSLHAYWLADNGSMEHHADILQGLVEKFNGDKGAKGINRVLRVPGFYHMKSDVPFEVKVIKYNPELKYTDEEMAGNFHVEKKV